MDTLYRKMNLENRIDKLSEINLGVEKNIEFIEKNKDNVFKLYKVFNGVFIMYSDVNMEESSGIFKFDSDLLLINHCKDGKVEYKRTGGRSNFLNAGEVKVGVKKSLDEELSKMFNISSTKLKHCFKAVYGEPIFSYMKSYRINHAAQILRTNKMIKIIDVAGMVGYDSPSKFSVAFKKKKGLSPKDYRKKFVKIKVLK